MLANVPAPLGLRGHARIAFVTFTDTEHEVGKVVFGSDQQIPNTSCWVNSTQLASKPLDLDTVHLRAERSNLPAFDYVTSLIADFRPCFVLTCGTGGGITDREDLKVGDLVIGDFIEYYEFAKVSSEKPKKHWYSRASRSPSEARVQPRRVPFDQPAALLRQNLAQYVQEKPGWRKRIGVEPPPNASPKVLTGMILTGEKILQAHQTEYQDALLLRYDKALVVETESYGVASALYRARSDKQDAFRYHYNPLFLAIRGISDPADAPGAQAYRDQWSKYAAHAACVFALEIAERLIATLEK